MSTLKIDGAAAPRVSTPANDEALAGRTAQGFQEIEQDESTNCRGTPPSGQALRAIEGEHKAGVYLARLHAQQAHPDELALIVSMLCGSTLRGFCRVIEKALGVQHG